MKYMGSKRRIWKEISPIILKDRKENQIYIEPFCGGCNSLINVSGRRIASDANPYLIAMLKSVLANEPQYYPIPRDLYNEARIAYKNKDYSKFSISDLGWIGYMASFNGGFFEASYSGIYENKEKGIMRNYINEAIKNLLDSISALRGVIFKCCSYDELIIPKNSIVYCDPPYKNTSGYPATPSFDYDRFYSWLKRISKQGNKVFISEYWMPSEFKEIWSKTVSVNLNPNKSNNLRIEKLFTI